MEIERERRAARTVNLTPLIDVVFLLIVFFMLSTSFVMSESLELSLPSRGGAKKAVQGDNRVMNLVVKQDGGINVSGKEYDITMLDTVLQKVIEKNPDQRMMILSTDNVSVQQLVAVMDMIYLIGGKQVQIDHYGREGAGFDVQLENYNPQVK